MSCIPLVGIAAWSSVGKTTLIEVLIPELNALGLRVAVIKHDAHGLILDGSGKDSDRFAKAGAASVLACSDGVVLLREGRQRTLGELRAMVTDADLILAEGFKREPITQIGLYRLASGKGLTAPPDRFAAIVTDDPAFRAEVPVFRLDQTRELAAFLFAHRTEFL